MLSGWDFASAINISEGDAAWARLNAKVMQTDRGQTFQSFIVSSPECEWATISIWKLGVALKAISVPRELCHLL
jgi:hypothetical protein